MVFISQYEISTDGSQIILLNDFDYIRTQVDGALLVKGPANSAGLLVKIPGVIAVRELDDYAVDLSNGQATVKQGELVTKDKATITQEQPKQVSIALLLEIGLALYILVKVVLK
jgi:hypothetical protein